MVEKRWRGVCKSENEISAEGGLNSSVFPFLPSDSELAAAFVDRKRRSVEIHFRFVTFFSCFFFLGCFCKNHVNMYFAKIVHLDPSEWCFTFY